MCVFFNGNGNRERAPRLLLSLEAAYALSDEMKMIYIG